MNRTLPLIATCAALALTACSREPDAENSDAPTAAAGTGSTTPISEPQGPAPLPTPWEAEGTGAAIPTALRGRWGLVPADCTSTRGDAKGLLEVSAGQLKFYESVAKLGAVKEAGETRLRATFDFSGEGQSWAQDVVLDAQDGGQVLIRRDYGPDAMPGPLKYTRCT